MSEKHVCFPERMDFANIMEFEKGDGRGTYGGSKKKAVHSPFPKAGTGA
jgi:hypothetical protein